MKLSACTFSSCRCTLCTCIDIVGGKHSRFLHSKWMNLHILCTSSSLSRLLACKSNPSADKQRPDFKYTHTHTLLLCCSTFETWMRISSKIQCSSACMLWGGSITTFLCQAIPDTLYSIVLVWLTQILMILAALRYKHTICRYLCHFQSSWWNWHGLDAEQDRALSLIIITRWQRGSSYI